jgi:hypothetical protein
LASSLFTHGLRRGLRSYAASRLGIRADYRNYLRQSFTRNLFRLHVLFICGN